MCAILDNAYFNFSGVMLLRLKKSKVFLKWRSLKTLSVPFRPRAGSVLVQGSELVAAYPLKEIGQRR